jgi:hypothetical protein
MKNIKKASSWIYTANFAAMLAITLAVVSAASAHAADRSPNNAIKRVKLTYKTHECPIEVNDPYGGDIDDSSYGLEKVISIGKGKIQIVTLFIQLYCLSSDDVDHASTFPARFDQGSMRWIKDTSQIDPLLKDTLKSFPLNSVNSLGIGFTSIMSPPGNDGTYAVDFSYRCHNDHALDPKAIDADSRSWLAGRRSPTATPRSMPPGWATSVVAHLCGRGFEPARWHPALASTGLKNMARYADEPHELERVPIAVNGKTYCYYRSTSFWKASAAVNLPSAIEAEIADGSSHPRNSPRHLVSSN